MSAYSDQDPMSPEAIRIAQHERVEVAHIQALNKFLIDRLSLGYLRISQKELMDHTGCKYQHNLRVLLDLFTTKGWNIQVEQERYDARTNIVYFVFNTKYQLPSWMVSR